MLENQKSNGSIDPELNLESEIFRLKKALNATIISHYCQDSEIQDVSDFVGDSLNLIKRVTSHQGLITMCCPFYVFESAQMLNPEKKIITPTLYNTMPKSSCDLTLVEELQKFKQQNPAHVIIADIKSSIKIKTLANIIVSASNVEEIINQLSEDTKILFVTNQNLGNYLLKKTQMNIKLVHSNYNFNTSFSERELTKLKTTYPLAKIIAHPECDIHLLEYADYIAPADSLISFVKNNQPGEFIVLADPGIVHQMYLVSPKSKFYDVPRDTKNKSTEGISCDSSLQSLYSFMQTITVNAN